MSASKSIEIVDICSSDEENEPAIKRSDIDSSNQQYKQQKYLHSGSAILSPTSNPALEKRSFWKAGDIDSYPANPNPSQDCYIEHARVHPKFLHSNATSHKWAFGAMAELLDNAVDEIYNGATFVKVDKIYNMKDNSPALLFHDDGGGMNPDQLRKCLSFGYSSKKTTNTIGRYGNGFKTSTMRLGADAIVFSRTNRPRKSTQSIGLLSYTFLCITGQDDVIVPMVDFDISKNWMEPIIYSSDEDWSINFKNIIEWSPFASNEDLMLQFEDMESHGTKIIIYNLWQNDEGIFELNFDDDDEDIQLRDESSPTSQKRSRMSQSHISHRLCFSLRAYTSMLYLRQFENFSILLRGVNVHQLNLADELMYIHKDLYRPQLGRTSNDSSVEITLGFNKGESIPGVGGFNVYHKNRLIKPFWKVSSDSHIPGSGIIGFLEANFIEPAHDKQDFERSPLVTRLESKLKLIVIDYWKRHCPLTERPQHVSEETPKEKHGFVGFSEDSVYHSTGLSENVERGINNLQPTMNFKEEVNLPVPRSLQDISAENVQLFSTCEEHRRKERELKQTIEELEKELKQAIGNCSQLEVLRQRKI